MDFKDTLKMYTDEVNNTVYKYLPKEEGLQKLIFEAMNYSVKNGGKRLRPLMIRESYRFCGGKKELEDKIVEPFMAALEMIHSYSLVHDDLPDMDNDMYRRGKLTTHAAYGADVAILAGDGLLNFAFETASEAQLYAAEHCDKDVLVATVKAMKILGTKAGVYGMVGGQTVDVVNTGKPIDDETIDFIYSLKTGALLEASLMIGATLACADEKEVKELEGIGHKVGLAFQIKDDILDETSTAEVLGKPIHSDAINEKTTYVTLHGIEASEKEVKRLTDEATASINNLDEKYGKANPFLKQLLDSLVTRVH